MKIYVVRHCSTVRSEQKIFCGNTDLPLSPRGEEEAKGLAALATVLAPDAILSSPLLRAKQTAEAIAGGRVPILYDGRLRERDFGEFEGTDCSRPDGWKYRHNFALRYPGGESYLDVAARIYPFLDEIRQRFAEKTVLLVSHGSACRVIRSYFCEMADEEFYAYSQPNGGVEEYEI